MSTLTGKTIGCIGAGAMGGAIVSRLAGPVAPAAIIVADIDSARTAALKSRHGITVAAQAAEAARADIVIVAVKPDAVPAILAQIAASLTPSAIIVSIAAGVTLATLEAALGAERKIARVMPNTPAMIGEGMSVIAVNGAMDRDATDLVEAIFTLTGRALVMAEKHLDAVTGLSGSGPAYVFTFIQALTDAGVKLGIPRAQSLILAAQTVMGAAKYLLESGDDPISLRGRVTSPGGTTIEAVHVLERSGFSGIVIDAVVAAAEKSRRLGGY